MNRLVLFIRNNLILTLVVLLLLTIFSRFSLTYTDKTNIVSAPEKIFQVVPIGIDFFTGVIKPAINIRDGKNFYNDIAIYGPALSITMVPAINLLTKLNVCSLVDLHSCSRILYHWFLIITIVGYLLLTLLVGKTTTKETLSAMLLYLAIFLLSFMGSFGLERGNIDIFLSLINGFIIYLLLLAKEKSTNKFSLALILSVAIGLLTGFSSNAKIFLFPISLVAIVFSPNMFISGALFLLTFFGLIYLPHVFGAPSDLSDLIKWSFTYITKAPVTPFHTTIHHNHSFAATASLFTSCIFKQTCEETRDILIISSVTKALFVTVFVLPFLSIRELRKKIIFNFKYLIKDLVGYLRQFIKWLPRTTKKIYLSQEWVLLLFILIDALINLVPKYSFSFRLYYSLPVLLILLAKTENNPQVRLYSILSIVFLSLKGLWIFLVTNPHGRYLFEPRGMNFFVILHFYFLIKAGLANILFNKRQ